MLTFINHRLKGHPPPHHPYQPAVLPCPQKSRHLYGNQTSFRDINEKLCDGTAPSASANVNPTFGIILLYRIIRETVGTPYEIIYKKTKNKKKKKYSRTLSAASVRYNIRNDFFYPVKPRNTRTRTITRLIIVIYIFVFVCFYFLSFCFFFCVFFSFEMVNYRDIIVLEITHERYAVPYGLLPTKMVYNNEIILCGPKEKRAAGNNV